VRGKVNWFKGIGCKSDENWRCSYISDHYREGVINEDRAENLTRGKSLIDSIP
jgi:hypothetical protein